MMRGQVAWRTSEEGKNAARHIHEPPWGEARCPWQQSTFHTSGATHRATFLMMTKHPEATMALLRALPTHFT